MTGRVSVIIPARNEEATIERAVQSLALQEAAREIIVADDGSTDRTAEILKGLEREIPRLRVLRLDSLPDGWTGKTHAAAAGANAAEGDWLLFTDADTVHMLGSLQTLLTRAEQAGADLLSVSPGQETPTWWERAVIPRVFVQLARWYPFEEISNPSSRRAAANGQYILIRRNAYQSAGGFESVRGEILEDVALAERVKAMGGRIVFLPGAEWVRTRMYRRFGAMWQGWTKNLFPLAGSDTARLLRAAAACLVDLLPVTASLALVFWFLVARGLTVLGIAWVCLLIGYLQRRGYARELARLGYDRNSDGRVMGSALLGLLLLNSWWAHRVSRRIEWKGRSYPVKQVQK